tara:strand:- start:4938 stop:6227 length:1290 start_codon:yes stop_codon:yes gene_type:complete
MLNKVKNIIFAIDRFLFKKFGSDKSIQLLLNVSEVKLIFSNLNQIGKEDEVRFVGGCVRKSLSGEEIDDIDLATSLSTEEVKIRLAKKDIRVIDTGLSHGTVTAIINKKKFEITTLRKDVFTDGRHAQVQFTKSWEEDSLRRDLTINAIYADIHGRIFDPLNGIDDLKNGKVKFIGNAPERIQEDYLRILRYFRFFANYSKFEHEPDIIKAIKQNINGINKISNERIFDELKKILLLKNIYILFSNDQSKEILLNIFPQFKYYKRLKKFNDFDDKFKIKYNKYLVLALLILDETKEYEYFCHKFKISNKVIKKFKNISKNYQNLISKKFFSENNIKKLIYLTNKDDVIDLLLFSLLINNKIKSSEIEKLINFVNHCKIPKFPISGDYLKKYGYEAGPKLGEKLKALENKWIENDFILDERFIEKSAKMD